MLQIVLILLILIVLVGIGDQTFVSIKVQQKIVVVS